MARRYLFEYLSGPGVGHLNKHGGKRLCSIGEPPIALNLSYIPIEEASISVDRQYQSIGCLIFHHFHLVSVGRRYHGAIINISDDFHVVSASRRYHPNSERFVD